MVRCGELDEEMVEDDDEYAKLVRRMNPPRVVIDNDSYDNATVIRVDRVKKHGILLEAVQVLVDLNLVVTKAYISSDGNWFMDVFNVTDQDGSKLVNREIIDCIQRCLESEDGYLVSPASGPAGCVAPSEESTSIELTGTDRPGLLSEVCAVLASLSCNIVKAEVWTHDRRAAAIIQIIDEATGLAIRDAGRLSKVQELLCNVMQGDGGGGGGCSSGVAKKGNTALSVGAAHAERRLHRLMLDDGDGGQDPGGEGRSGKVKKAEAKVVVMDCTERRYTVVILRCKDRPKLLFDTLCALTDLQYVVFHGTVDAEGSSKEAYQVSTHVSTLTHHQLLVPDKIAHLPRRRVVAGVLHPARRRAPGALRHRADPPHPVPRGGHREARFGRAGAGGEDGGQGGAPLRYHARVPREQPVDHPGSDLHQERRGRRHLLRVGRLRQPRRRQDHGLAERAARPRRAEGEAQQPRGHQARGGGQRRVHPRQPAQGLVPGVQAPQTLLLRKLLLKTRPTLFIQTI